MWGFVAFLFWVESLWFFSWLEQKTWMFVRVVCFKGHFWTCRKHESVGTQWGSSWCYNIWHELSTALYVSRRSSPSPSCFFSLFAAHQVDELSLLYSTAVTSHPVNMSSRTKKEREKSGSRNKKEAAIPVVSLQEGKCSLKWHLFCCRRVPDKNWVKLLWIEETRQINVDSERQQTENRAAAHSKLKHASFVRHKKINLT